ncbi:MAG: ABC transporter ATP-binding protein [Promethearchaeota archaeon]
MKNKIIETQNLTKIFKFEKDKNKKIIALNSINFSVREGEIFGLLGPNAAGKTTLVQILTTLIKPTKGKAFVNGYNVFKQPNKAKKNVALMIDNSMSYPSLTGYQNLAFYAKIFSVPNYKKKILRLTKEFGLDNALNQYTTYYSTGMKMKLALCRTLLLGRKILFLDEPTLGLDLNTKYYIINKLKNLKEKTIFITSHDMSVVEALCKRIAFINKGEIIKIGNKEDLKRVGKKSVEIIIEISNNKFELIKELEQENFINYIKETNSGLLINFKDRCYYKNLLSILWKYNISMIKEKELQLENLFFHLIN